MLLRGTMKRIKIGNYYLLDESGDLSLKEYEPVKVRQFTNKCSAHLFYSHLGRERIGLFKYMWLPLIW